MSLNNIFINRIFISRKWKWSCSVMSWLSAIPWTVVYQASLSMRFSRQEYWSGLPFPSPKVSINYMAYMHTYMVKVWRYEWRRKECLGCFNRICGSFFPLALLRYSWCITSYSLKVYNIRIWYTYVLTSIVKFS